MKNKLETSHILVRKDGVLCTRCYITEPVHAGGGTPMSSYLIALEQLAARHQHAIKLYASEVTP